MNDKICSCLEINGKLDRYVVDDFGTVGSSAKQTIARFGVQGLIEGGRREKSRQLRIGSFGRATWNRRDRAVRSEIASTQLDKDPITF